MALTMAATKNVVETTESKFWHLMCDDDFVFKHRVGNTEGEDGEDGKVMEIHPVKCQPCDVVRRMILSDCVLGRGYRTRLN